MASKNQYELTVYYDGLCVICSKEIEMYRKKDLSNKIDFIDISSAHFDASQEGLDPTAVKKMFHVRKQNGELLIGIDAFQEIWQVLEIFKPLSHMVQFPLTRPIFQTGYHLFTLVRPWLPRKNCDSGTCYT